MTDTQLGIIIAAITALLGGFAAFIKWLIGRAPEKEDVTGLTIAVTGLNSTMQNVNLAVTRLEAKFDAIMDERERTPIGLHSPSFLPPRNPQPGSEDDTPPLRLNKAQTPSGGVPYGPFNPSKKRR